MKNETNLFKRIRNIIVGNTLPKNEDLWIDTSNGEKNAVLKYKGYPIVGGASGGGSGSGSGCDCSGIKISELSKIQKTRPATEEDVAKGPSSGNGKINIGDPIIDLIDGVIPLWYSITDEYDDVDYYMIKAVHYNPEHGIGVEYNDNSNIWIWGVSTDNSIMYKIIMTQ